MLIMNFRKIKIFSLISILILVSVLFVSSQNSTDQLRRELLIKVLTFAIDNGHYKPADMNDDFSEKAFNLYIDRLDFGKRFLIQSDVDELADYKYEMDDAMRDLDFTLFDRSVSILDGRIVEAQGYYRDILEKPFDFKKNETYEYDPDKLEFAKNKQDLKDRWRKILKYEVLGRIHDAKQEQEKATEKSDTVTIKTIAELEIDARDKVLKRYDDWFHRMSKLDETDRLGTYVNALLSVMDPHTQYFPPRDKENFDIRFSGQLEGIGAQLTQKNAYIEVTKIIPGSPSWKQGELEVGDYILKVKQENEEPVDVVDMRLDDAVQLIRGKKGTQVTLTIRKLDKTIKEITLVRDVVVLEETYAKSAVYTDDETGIKYGYLKLPSFYVDFSQMNGKNCYDDVVLEIEKLKDENIQGLVFDLRDNGGGSLEDVVKIAGLFIEEGPVVQSVGKRSNKKILTDKDPHIQYAGPMIVMVNAISASASEIFAAAMQDYDRAIIVGGKSTYGKGTVQNFTELDRMVPRKPADMEELGSVKMTIQKFYRIDGGATQLKGVTPDLVMPDYYNYMDFGEKDLEYAMPWDEIEPLTWNAWTPTYDEDYILEISRKRVDSDTLFRLIEENGRRLEELRENSTYDLNYQAYEKTLTEREKAAEKFDRIGKDTFDIKIDVLAYDLPEILADTSKKARTDAWIKDLTKDVYLVEAFNILEDIHNYEVKNARKEEER
jgi:carboxyl-terminal processing protease